MIRYAKHGLRMGEVWLDAPFEPQAGIDVLLLQQFSRLPAGAHGIEFHSLSVDLTQSEDALLGRMDSNVRYDVRRAESKDGVTCVTDSNITDAQISEFQDFYSEFASAKSLPALPSAELTGRAKSGELTLSRAVWQGRTVVWHAHIVARDCATLLHSASHFRATDAKDERAVIGRANKLLHWMDMKHFREARISRYDFGGWYAGNSDQALMSINAFKERFGGDKVKQVNGALPLTWRGMVYVRLRHIFSARQRKLLGNVLHKLLDARRGL